MKGHNVFACSRLSKKPKCGKCGGGHKTKNYGLECSYCFSLEHIALLEKEWNLGLAIANYLEVMMKKSL
jgi:hypothetical protein